MTVDELMQLPWHWVGPRRIEEDGDEFFELRVAELPDFYVAGADAAAVRGEASAALRAFLKSYVDVGQTPPLPDREQKRWRWGLKPGPGDTPYVAVEAPAIVGIVQVSVSPPDTALAHGGLMP